MSIRPILKSLLVPRVTQRIKRNCRIRAVLSFIKPPPPQRNHHAEWIYLIIWVSKGLASLVCKGSRNYGNNSELGESKEWGVETQGKFRESIAGMVHLTVPTLEARKRMWLKIRVIHRPVIFRDWVKGELQFLTQESKVKCRLQTLTFRLERWYRVVTGI